MSVTEPRRTRLPLLLLRRLAGGAVPAFGVTAVAAMHPARQRACREARAIHPAAQAAEERAKETT
jgi:hypothetical protein